jgi:hypothetical protein
MTDTQLWLAIGVPTIAVLLGILLNVTGLNRLETRIDTRLLVIEGDLRRFYQILGEHSAKVENLEKRVDKLP